MSERPPLSAVEKLTREHNSSEFRCGNPALDGWLQDYAWMNQTSGSAVTYVVHRANAVAGYFSICAGSVEREEAPKRVAKGLAKHPIPVVLLARLAIDEREQGTGLGAALLKDALVRINAAADELGVRAVLVHAVDAKAKSFYEHFGFEPSPLDPYQLFLLLKDLRAALK